MGDATNEDLTFSSVGPSGVVHYTRCWPCMCGQHPGGMHDWADANDIRHAESLGYPSPAGQRCGCHCVDEPPRDEEGPEPDLVSLDAAPCPVCGATNACAWDDEGQPLIHAIEVGDDT